MVEHLGRPNTLNSALPSFFARLAPVAFPSSSWHPKGEPYILTFTAAPSCEKQGS